MAVVGFGAFRLVEVVIEQVHVALQLVHLFFRGLLVVEEMAVEARGSAQQQSFACALLRLDYLEVSLAPRFCFDWDCFGGAVS